jgi:hypothetical protein
MTFNHKVILPIALKNRALSKKVFAFPVFLVIFKITHVFVLVSLFKIAEAVNHVFAKLTHIFITDTVYNMTLPLAHVVIKLTLINIAIGIDEDTLAKLLAR